MIDKRPCLSEFELWQTSLRRYNQINGLIDKLYLALRAEGIEGVTPCGFCMAYSRYPIGDCNKKCPWGMKFGYCHERDSEWDKRKEGVLRIKENVEYIISEIEYEIKRLGG